MKADIFFFITSVVAGVVGVILIIAGFYLVMILRNVRDVSEKVKRGVNLVGEDAETVYAGIKQSFLGNIFSPRRKHTRTTSRNK